MIRTEPSRPGENMLLSWGEELDELDAQIKALQDSKRDFYTAIRDNHGKVTADALKAAQRIRGMDSEKRAKAEEVDAETARILAVLEKPRAPRATRAREIIEQIPPHDPEAGEVEEQKSAGNELPAEARQPSARPMESSATIPDPQPTSSPEADKAEAAPPPVSAVIPDDDVPAFLKQDRQPLNERCERPKDCKYAHHPQKLTCSTCKTAWQIAQRRSAA